MKRSTGTPTIDPSQMNRYRMASGWQVGARELPREVRAEIAALDDLVEVGERLALLG